MLEFPNCKDLGILAYIILNQHFILAKTLKKAKLFQ